MMTNPVNFLCNPFPAMALQPSFSADKVPEKVLIP